MQQLGARHVRNHQVMVGIFPKQIVQIRLILIQETDLNCLNALFILDWQFSANPFNIPTSTQ